MSDLTVLGSLGFIPEYVLAPADELVNRFLLDDVLPHMVPVDPEFYTVGYAGGLWAQYPEAMYALSDGSFLRLMWWAPGALALRQHPNREYDLGFVIDPHDRHGGGEALGTDALFQSVFTPLAKTDGLAGGTDGIELGFRWPTEEENAAFDAIFDNYHEVDLAVEDERLSNETWASDCLDNVAAFADEHGFTASL